MHKLLPLPYVIEQLCYDYAIGGTAAYMVNDTRDEFSIRRIDPSEINGYFFTYA